VPIAAVVLAAGAGTRLRPLTALRPKPLCPVNNVPLVDLALAHAAAALGTGDRRDLRDAVAVNACHLREQLAAHLHGRVHLSLEDEPLGTAGALGNLRDWLAGRDVLVLNADAWRRDGVAELLDGWDGVRQRLLVVEDPARGDFGRYRYTGAALLPWAAVRDLEPRPSGLYEVLWRGRDDLDLAVAAHEFRDCGTPADYLDANLAASGGRPVVGEGARVEGELVRSVVWPGAVVEAGERLVDAVRATHGVTVRPYGLEGRPPG
jgi:NDP-sugar pyrophosphorylase family protein